MSDSSIITLTCWIVGDDLTERFPVQIDRDKRVKDLRQAIKEERDDIPYDIKAANIMLWQVSIPTTNFCWNEYSIYELLSEADPLVPTERLATVYPTTPEQDHVHVIAWTRNLTLNCWIVGDRPRSIFPVTINNNQDIADLQQVIKEKGHSVVPPNIDELDIMLWKVSILAKGHKRDEDIKQFLEDKNKLEPFLPIERLSDIYPAPPPQDRIHIIVSYPWVLDLECWIVENHGKKQMFTITVNSTQLVSDLQRLLQEKALVPAYIEPPSLWRVSIPVDYPNIERRAKEITEKEDKLIYTWKLSDIFVMPPESGHIHVAIWYPKY